MTWHDVSAHDDIELTQVVEILQACHPSVFYQTPAQEKVDLCRDLAWGKQVVRCLITPQFQIVVCFRYNPKRERHYICPNFAGQIEPAEALDLVIAQAIEYLHERELNCLYGMQPRQTEQERIQRFYDLVHADLRLKCVILQVMSDLISYSIELATQHSTSTPGLVDVCLT